MKRKLLELAGDILMLAFIAGAAGVILCLPELAEWFNG